MGLRIACVGGGPGGLFFATQQKLLTPSSEVVVFERNQPHDSFGFGVVFSDSTLAQIDAVDPVVRDALRNEGTHWDRIEVWSKGERHGFSGNGMAAIHRKVLLSVLQQRARTAGVELRFGADIRSLDELTEFDVIVGADGANSRVRDEIGDQLGHRADTAAAKFIWFGTEHLFPGLTFLHRRNDHGNFAAHAYPISDGLSTFIVETDADTWRAAGLDSFDVEQPPGISDEHTREYLSQLFADDLRGAKIVGNNSRWASFKTRRTDRWHHANVVLLGDAMHTAHFSVGSGTKMAMEDGIVLAQELAARHSTLADSFAAYQAERQPKVDKIQRAAQGGLGWWERFGIYHQAMDPAQFAFHFFSRSIDIDRIEPRDPELVADARQRWRNDHGAEVLDTPLCTSVTRLPGRLLRRSGGDLRHGDIQVARLGDGLGKIIVGEGQPDAPAELIIVEGGDVLERLRLSEDLRLRDGVPTIVDAAAGELDPETVVLAGRADAVAIHD